MGIYDRQSEIELDRNFSITVCGAGGIGFWVTKLAAMSGIQTIYVFDPDVIEDTNLNRLDIPDKFIGKNKADVIAGIVRALRPNCNIYPRPFVLQTFNYTKTDWLIDCTDKLESQRTNSQIAKNTGTVYCKAGYNGEDISINNEIAEWGESPDGYTITPSWVVPSIVVASLTVAKIMKYKASEISTSIKEILRNG